MAQKVVAHKAAATQRAAAKGGAKGGGKGDGKDLVTTRLG